jgi:hypothetical protein
MRVVLFNRNEQSSFTNDRTSRSVMPQWTQWPKNFVRNVFDELRKQLGFTYGWARKITEEAPFVTLVNFGLLLFLLWHQVKLFRQSHHVWEGFVVDGMVLVTMAFLRSIFIKRE